MRWDLCARRPVYKVQWQRGWGGGGNAAGQSQRGGRGCGEGKVPKKNLTKYLLQATMGPATNQGKRKLAHVCVAWPVADNRETYRPRLMVAVTDLLNGFAAECNTMRSKGKSHIANYNEVITIYNNLDHF